MPGFITLTNRATGQDEQVDVDQALAAIASGRYLDPGAIAVHRDGLDTYTTPDVAAREQAFTPTIDPARAALAQGHVIRERANSGVGAALKAGVGGAVSGATAGLLSPYADEQEFNPLAAGVGQVAGIIGPALLGDEAGLAGALPSSLISRAGAGVGERLGGGLFAGGVAGAVEGSLYGVGQGTGELLRSDDPLTMEHIASSLSSNALYGAAGGFAGGVLAKGAELGLARAKAEIDGVLARTAVNTVAPEVAAEGAGGAAALRGPAVEGESDALTRARAGQDFPEDHSDLLHMTEDQLAAAHAKETESLANYRKASSESFAANASRARELDQAARPWDAIRGSEVREERTIANQYRKADNGIRGALDNPIALVDNPERLRAPLQAQQHALNQLDKIRAREQALFDDAVEHAPEQIRHEILAKQVPGELGPFSAHGLDLAVDREIARRFGDLANPTKPARLLQLERVPKVLERNRGLLGDLDRLAAEPTSARLRDIEAHMEELGAPAPTSIGHEVLKAALPFVGGPLGAIAAAGGKAVSGLRKVAGEAVQRSGKAVASFLGTASKAVGKAAPVAPVLATKVLGSVRFAPGVEGAAAAAATAPPAASKLGALGALYAARTSEIKSQVQIAPDGTYQMKPDARARMAAKLDGLRAVDPRAADQLETYGARRIAYLASIIPRLPDYGTMQIGPERRQTPDLQMRSWARSVAAVEDPDAVFARAAEGRVVPEDAAALRGVWPEKLADFTNKVAAELSGLRTRLPYGRRLALSILTGLPVDPAMTPAVLREIQSMYASEPGTAGGTQAPKAMPQFGSVKRPVGTPSQRREEGTR